MNTKQVVPALVAVTLLSLVPATKALAIEQHADAAKSAATRSRPTPDADDVKRAEDKNAASPAAVRTDKATENAEKAPTVTDAQKAYDAGSYEEAFIIVEPLAKLNRPDAEYLLGQMYEAGHGVKKDTEKALSLFTAAANQGYAAAQAKLGRLHLDGKKDYASAMNWFQKAADQGYALAYGAIGDLYAKGYGVDKDQDKALEYYRKAADAGDAAACLRLGQMYEQGKGVKVDREEAATWYKKGANLGSPECAAALKALDQKK